MDETIFQNKLTTQFNSLPKDVRDAILSVGLNEKLENISKTYALRIDQMTALENETLFVMMGLEPPGKYIANLKRELEIEEVLARKIAEDINAQIFRPIKESLKKIHRVEEGIAGEPEKPALPVEKVNAEKDTLPQKQETAETVPLIEHDSFHDNKELRAIKYKLKLGETPNNLPTGESAFAPQTQSGGADSEREKILHEIEGHANNKNKEPQMPNTKRNMVEERLGGIFKIPSKESEHTETSAPQTKPTVDTEKKTKPYGGTDPYREPVE